MAETGVDKELTYDVTRRTVDHYVQQILDRVQRAAEVDFRDLFDPERGRYELIGVFTAMLEMMKQGYLSALQDDASGTVRVTYTGSPDATPDQILRGDEDDIEDDIEELDDESIGDTTEPGAAAAASPA